MTGRKLRLLKIIVLLRLVHKGHKPLIKVKKALQHQKQFLSCLNEIEGFMVNCAVLLKMKKHENNTIKIEFQYH